MWVGELIICYKKRELQDTMEIWVKISIGVCGIQSDLFCVSEYEFVELHAYQLISAPKFFKFNSRPVISRIGKSEGGRVIQIF